MNIFVYGTLRRGGKLHSYMKGACFVKSAILADGYRMQDGGWYPIIVPTLCCHDRKLQSSPIAGEIFEISDDKLVQLDVVEGCNQNTSEINGGLYKRTLVSIDGYKCWVYYQAKCSASRQMVTCGDWFVYCGISLAQPSGARMG